MLPSKIKCFIIIFFVQVNMFQDVSSAKNKVYSAGYMQIFQIQYYIL